MTFVGVNRIVSAGFRSGGNSGLNRHLAAAQHKVNVKLVVSLQIFFQQRVVLGQHGFILVKILAKAFGVLQSDVAGGKLGLLLRRWQVGFLADFDVGFNVFAVGHLAQLFSRQFF